MQENSAVTSGPNAASGSQPLPGENPTRRAKTADPGHLVAATRIGQPDLSFAAAFSLALGAAHAGGQEMAQGQPSADTTIAGTVNPVTAEAIASTNADAIVATGVAAAVAMAVSSPATPVVAAQRHAAPPPVRDGTQDRGTSDATDISEAAVSSAQQPVIAPILPPPLPPGPGHLMVPPKPAEAAAAGMIDTSLVPARPAHLIDAAPAAGAESASPSHSAVESEKPSGVSSTPERAVSAPTTLIATAAAEFPTAAFQPAHNRSSAATAPLAPVSAMTVASAPPVAEPKLPGITPIDQIAPALIHLSTADGARHISLQLTPSSLGTVDIQIDQPVSGPTTITLTVQHADTLALLHKDIEQLMKALDRAGFDDGARSISLHLAPAHAQLPTIAPASQSPPSHGQNPQSQGGAWQGAAFGQGAGSQGSTSNGDQRRPLQPTWQDLPGAGPHDDTHILAPSAASRLHTRAGLNITA